ncbi:serpin H1 [Aricia agestis]|uniref:serpin H1 n=1 Tax=Aricia agestis TaxID=91739 RepID=UPI001C209E9C|nr:serpin H1 [Aricia agestis]
MRYIVFRVVHTMKWNGRSRAAGRGFVRFVCICSFIARASAEYGVPIEIKLWDSQRSPLSHMVDVTNEFGLKVLAEHNFLNENNIAFSPYGLMGILVALFEGVDGESSYQIQRSMQLPWNRNVMRIGFRDIHRTLKTYFIPEEGFLAGLALNNDNVTFNEAYVKILRFYGFDLEAERAPSKPDNISTTSISTSEATTPVNNNVPSNDNTVITTTPNTREETTLNPNAENIDNPGPKQETTPSVMPTPQKEETTSVMTTPTRDETTASVMTTPATEETTPSVTTTPSTSEAIESTTMTSQQTQSPTLAEPQMMIETTTASLTTITSTTEAQATTNVADTTTAPNTASDTTTSNVASTMSDMSSTTPDTVATADGNVEDAPSSTTIETLQRRKKSILNFVYTSPPYVEQYAAYRAFNIGPDLPEIDPDYDKMFSVNGLRNIEVTYMNYDTILDHAFLPHLEASALRLPLDSEKYYLLVVLPMRRGVVELERLLSRMARESDLSDIYSALRPCRVRAAVPSFVVKGHVTLTTDLQKLGMRNVFEPRQHDFTPMTHQAGVYVRSIEQAVSVAIRKYQQTDTPKGYIPSANFVYFSATYPFLYFVMDSNIHVALMAGKLVDPLNTRIL